MTVDSTSTIDTPSSEVSPHEHQNGRNGGTTGEGSPSEHQDGRTTVEGSPHEHQDGGTTEEGSPHEHQDGEIAVEGSPSEHQNSRDGGTTGEDSPPEPQDGQTTVEGSPHEHQDGGTTEEGSPHEHQDGGIPVEGGPSEHQNGWDGGKTGEGCPPEHQDGQTTVEGSPHEHQDGEIAVEGSPSEHQNGRDGGTTGEGSPPEHQDGQTTGEGSPHEHQDGEIAVEGSPSEHQNSRDGGTTGEDSPPEHQDGQTTGEGSPHEHQDRGTTEEGSPHEHQDGGRVQEGSRPDHQGEGKAEKGSFHEHQDRGTPEEGSPPRHQYKGTVEKDSPPEHKDEGTTEEGSPPEHKDKGTTEEGSPPEHQDGGTAEESEVFCSPVDPEPGIMMENPRPDIGDTSAVEDSPPDLTCELHDRASCDNCEAVTMMKNLTPDIETTPAVEGSEHQVRGTTEESIALSSTVHCEAGKKTGVVTEVLCNNMTTELELNCTSQNIERNEAKEKECEPHDVEGTEEPEEIQSASLDEGMEEPNATSKDINKDNPVETKIAIATECLGNKSQPDSTSLGFTKLAETVLIMTQETSRDSFSEESVHICESELLSLTGDHNLSLAESNIDEDQEDLVCCSKTSSPEPTEKINEELTPIILDVFSQGTSVSDFNYSPISKDTISLTKSGLTVITNHEDSDESCWSLHDETGSFTKEESCINQPNRRGRPQKSELEMFGSNPLSSDCYTVTELLKSFHNPFVKENIKRNKLIEGQNPSVEPKRRGRPPKLKINNLQTPLRNEKLTNQNFDSNKCLNSLQNSVDKSSNGKTEELTCSTNHELKTNAPVNVKNRINSQIINTCVVNASNEETQLHSNQITNKPHSVAVVTPRELINCTLEKVTSIKSLNAKQKVVEDINTKCSAIKENFPKIEPSNDQSIDDRKKEELRRDLISRTLEKLTYKLSRHAKQKVVAEVDTKCTVVEDNLTKTQPSNEQLIEDSKTEEMRRDLINRTLANLTKYNRTRPSEEKSHEDKKVSKLSTKTCTTIDDENNLSLESFPVRTVIPRKSKSNITYCQNRKNKSRKTTKPANILPEKECKKELKSQSEYSINLDHTYVETQMYNKVQEVKCVDSSKILPIDKLKNLAKISNPSVCLVDIKTNESYAPNNNIANKSKFSGEKEHRSKQEITASNQTSVIVDSKQYFSQLQLCPSLGSCKSIAKPVETLSTSSIKNKSNQKKECYEVITIEDDEEDDKSLSNPPSPLVQDHKQLNKYPFKKSAISNNFKTAVQKVNEENASRESVIYVDDEDELCSFPLSSLAQKQKQLNKYSIGKSRVSNPKSTVQKGHRSIDNASKEPVSSDDEFSSTPLSLLAQKNKRLNEFSIRKPGGSNSPKTTVQKGHRSIDNASKEHVSSDDEFSSTPLSLLAQNNKRLNEFSIRKPGVSNSPKTIVQKGRRSIDNALEESGSSDDEFSSTPLSLLAQNYKQLNEYSILKPKVSNNRNTTLLKEYLLKGHASRKSHFVEDEKVPSVPLLSPARNSQQLMSPAHNLQQLKKCSVDNSGVSSTSKCNIQKELIPKKYAMKVSLYNNEGHKKSFSFPPSIAQKFLNNQKFVIPTGQKQREHAPQEAFSSDDEMSSDVAYSVANDLKRSVGSSQPPGLIKNTISNNGDLFSFEKPGESITQNVNLQIEKELKYTSKDPLINIAGGQVSDQKNSNKFSSITILDNPGMSFTHNSNLNMGQGPNQHTSKESFVSIAGGQVTNTSHLNSNFMIHNNPGISITYNSNTHIGQDAIRYSSKDSFAAGQFPQQNLYNGSFLVLDNPGMSIIHNPNSLINIAGGQVPNTNHLNGNFIQNNPGMSITYNSNIHIGEQSKKYSSKEIIAAGKFLNQNHSNGSILILDNPETSIAHNPHSHIKSRTKQHTSKTNFSNVSGDQIQIPKNKKLSSKEKPKNYVFKPLFVLDGENVVPINASNASNYNIEVNNPQNIQKFAEISKTGQLTFEPTFAAMPRSSFSQLQSQTIDIKTLPKLDDIDRTSTELTNTTIQRETSNQVTLCSTLLESKNLELKRKLGVSGVEGCQNVLHQTVEHCSSTTYCKLQSSESIAHKRRKYQTQELPETKYNQSPSIIDNTRSNSGTKTRVEREYDPEVSTTFIDLDCDEPTSSKRRKYQTCHVTEDTIVQSNEIVSGVSSTVCSKVVNSSLNDEKSGFEKGQLKSMEDHLKLSSNADKETAGCKPASKVENRLHKQKLTKGKEDHQIRNIPKKNDEVSIVGENFLKKVKRVKSEEEELECHLDGLPPFIQDVFKCENMRYGFDTKDLIFVLSLLPDIEEMTTSQKVIFQLKTVEILNEVFNFSDPRNPENIKTYKRN